MKKIRFINFDIRIKFMILMLSSILTSLVHSDVLFSITIIILALYLLMQGHGVSALKYVIVTLIIYFLLYKLSGLPTIFDVILVMLAFILRIIPLGMASKPLFMANPSVIIASFEKINLPKPLFMPITFMLRFYPTVKFEFAKIRNALKLRGIISIKKPLLSLEYAIVPLMIRSSIISDQLSAAAEVRGISNPNRHTSIRKIEMQKSDLILSIIALTFTVCIILLDKGVFRKW